MEVQEYNVIMNNQKLGRGFTLIELLVVIAIIGILASIVLASLNTARKKGRDARRVSDMKQVQLALELFFDSNDSQYPIGNASPGYDMTNSATLDLAPAYIPALPVDPVNLGANVYKYVGTTDNGNLTQCAADTCISYNLRAVVEQAQAGYTTVNGTLLGDCTSSGTPNTSLNYCVSS